MKLCNETFGQNLFRLFLKGMIIGISLLILFHYVYENSSVYFKTNNLLRRRTIFSLHLNCTDLYLKQGEEFHLYVVALNKRVSFTSSNSRVAGVNFNGRVFGYQTGTAFILAKVDDRILKCRVHVMDISKKNVSLRTGKTLRLHIYGSNAFVRWRSTNSEVASINIFGKITTKRKGKATITARVKGKTFECKIKVK